MRSEFLNILDQLFCWILTLQILVSICHHGLNFAEHCDVRLVWTTEFGNRSRTTCISTDGTNQALGGHKEHEHSLTARSLDLMFDC